MEILQIIAQSWPLAVCFIALCAACLAFYVINWFKRSDIEDKALRASQAVVVRKQESDY